VQIESNERLNLQLNEEKHQNQEQIIKENSKQLQDMRSNDEEIR
jgi:hypothetical protein